MFILKKGHQPGVYVPLRALFLVQKVELCYLKLYGNKRLLQALIAEQVGFCLTLSETPVLGFLAVCIICCLYYSTEPFPMC